MFFVYATLGAFKFILALCLSKACEADPPKRTPEPNTETAPLLQANDEQTVVNPQKSRKWSLLPSISPESRPILVQLCILFAFDSFASGLAPMYGHPASYPFFGAPS